METRGGRIRASPALLFWLGLAGVTLAAFFIRFHRLGELPPGLHYDEAFDGLDAFSLLSAPLPDWPLFFTNNSGREPLFIYVLALAQKIAGPSGLTLRAVAACIAALLTPALAWLGWEAAPSLGCERRRLALWAGAAVLGVLSSQVFARYAIRVELFALVETLFLAALWRGWRTGRLAWFGLAGAVAGLSFYTYLPARLLPLVLLPAGLVVLLRRASLSAARRNGAIVASLAAIVVAAPLAIYFLRHPADFWLRIGQVAVAPVDAGFLGNILGVLGMFVVSGDANPRNNIPARPLLDALSGVFLLLGLLHLARSAKRPGALLILTWLVVMLAPTLFSQYAPSFQRAIGALPVVALLVAAGLDRLVAWLTARTPAAGGWFEGAGWLALVASIVIMWRAFAAWSALPELFYARDAGFVALAEELASRSDGDTVYLSPRGADHPTVRFVSLARGGGQDLRGFDGSTCVRIAAGPASYAFLVNEDARGPAALQSYLPDSRKRTLLADAGGRAWALELDQPEGGRVQFPEMRELHVQLEEGVELLGYWLSPDTPQPGERLYVRLFWQSHGQPQEDYTVFVHLLRRAPDGALVSVAGSDSQPGRGSCATSDWRPGETVVDELELVAPPDLSGAAYLEVGMYDVATGARVAVPGDPENRILIPLAP